MTYVSRHSEVFYKKVFLKALQNSQENSCAEVFLHATLIKNEALAQVVSCEFCEIGLKYKKANVCKCFPR